MPTAKEVYALKASGATHRLSPLVHFLQEVPQLRERLKKSGEVFSLNVLTRTIKETKLRGGGVWALKTVWYMHNDLAKFEPVMIIQLCVQSGSLVTANRFITNATLFNSLAGEVYNICYIEQDPKSIPVLKDTDDLEALTTFGGYSLSDSFVYGD